MDYITTYQGIHLWQFQAEFLTVKHAEFGYGPICIEILSAIQNNIESLEFWWRAKFRYVWTRLRRTVVMRKEWKLSRGLWKTANVEKLRWNIGVTDWQEIKNSVNMLHNQELIYLQEN